MAFTSTALDSPVIIIERGGRGARTRRPANAYDGGHTRMVSNVRRPSRSSLPDSIRGCVPRQRNGVDINVYYRRRPASRRDLVASQFKFRQRGVHRAMQPPRRGQGWPNGFGAFSAPVAQTAIPVTRASHPNPRRRSLMIISDSRSDPSGSLVSFSVLSSTYLVFESNSRSNSTPSNATNTTTRERMMMML